MKPFLVISQIETLGRALDDRLSELDEALRTAQQQGDQLLRALMVTDILDRQTRLVLVGDIAAAEREFGLAGVDGMVDLPGVMSRKKEVGPLLLTALG